MTNTLADVADKTFDYIIVGGGTAGLALAARLSADPALSVAVLEAGKANLDDPNILVPGQFAKTFLNPKYDWGFFTVPQRHCDDKVIPWVRGKTLGGSSAIHFMNWSKPSVHDINSFETLGNGGWNWETFEKYTRKSETFHEPTKGKAAVFPQKVDFKYRGTDGPIQTSIAHHVHTIDEPLMNTLKKMGVPTFNDPYGGNTVGSYLCSSTIDPKTQTRSYSTTAYYLPNKCRPNLTVLTEANVTRVLFAEAASPNEELIVTGVEFLHEERSYIVQARKEVILSAGTIKSPQLLEISGVGSRLILEQLGIEVKVDLPGVGENVQDHLYSSILYELNNKVDHQTLDLLRDSVVAAEQLELHASQQGMFCICPTAYTFLPLSLANPKDAPALIAQVAEEIDVHKASGSLHPGHLEQLDLQLEALRDDTTPDMEMLAFPEQFEPEKRYTTVMLFMNHPLSRGSIHAVSKDPTLPPAIDPCYFENHFDLEILVQAFKFARSMAAVEPWKSTVSREVQPGRLCTTDEQIRDYIKTTISPVWHAIGSCSMLPREKRGVVDPELKVYGTKNLRIVDISVFPLHISAHPQSLAYFVAEKAADIIHGHA